jgi:hypothetical protein
MYEVSSIDTALAAAGALQAGVYFGGDIRTLADTFYRRIDWVWMLNPQRKLLRGTWTPENGFSDRAGDGSGLYDSYCEAALMYLLAIGSPTHAISPECFYTWYRPKGNYQGPDFVHTWGGQAFVYQYPSIWYDFRNTDDALGVNWWQNAVEAMRANHRYCSNTPGYSSLLWGISAADGPDPTNNPYGYRGYGALPANYLEQDGTIAPTALGGAVPMTPDIAIPSLKFIYAAYGDQTWRAYGFVDSLNPSVNWFDSYYIAIDQGTILLMIENHRTGRIWSSFMQHPDVTAALADAGFTGYSAPAPDVSLDDLEDGVLWTPDSTLGWWESQPGTYNPAHVTSPVAEGLQALRIAYNKINNAWASFGGWISPTNPKRDFSNHQLLTMRVHGPAQLLVKLEDGNGAGQDIATVRTWTTNGWSRVTVGLERANIDLANVRNIVLFADPGVPTSSGQFVVDDVRLKSRSSTELEDFENGRIYTPADNPASALGWWTFDPSVYQISLVKNRSLGGFGGMEVNFNKNGLPWAFLGANISPNNPTKDFSGKTRVVIWVSGWQGILLKLRDRQGREQDVATKWSESILGWHRLEYDLSSLTGVNLADIEGLYFFVEPGNPAASGRFWIDDIAVE